MTDTQTKTANTSRNCGLQYNEETQRWASSRIFGWLHSRPEQWEGYIGEAHSRPAFLFTRRGDKKRYGVYLDELTGCATANRWLWKNVSVSRAGTKDIVFRGLSSKSAVHLVSVLTTTATRHATSAFALHHRELSDLQTQISAFTVPPDELPYLTISAFIEDQQPKIQKAKAAAVAILKGAFPPDSVQAKEAAIEKLAASISLLLDDMRNRGIADLTERLAACERTLGSFLIQIQQFKLEDRYLRHSAILRFVRTLWSQANEVVSVAEGHAGHAYAAKLESRKRVLDACGQIKRSANAADDSYARRNDLFIETELTSGNAVLAKLNEEQKKAAIVFEDRNLLVAAAGSGKSWTLVGKAGYALTRGLFIPSEILALAFNYEAADELNTKINRELRPYLGRASIKTHTFHALGLGIVRKQARREGRRIRIFGSCRKGQKAQATRDASERKLLHEIVAGLAANDASFLSHWTTFRTLCRQPCPTDDSFSSYQDYVDYVEEQRKVRRAGEPAFLQSLDGTVVKSIEELAIANWLWIHQVPFTYERDFTPKPPGWNSFNPDFYFPTIDTWLEHFGLDEYGRAPKHFNDPEWYAEQVKCKKKWFEDTVPGRWFCTTSADYRNGTLFEDLHAQLAQRGITPVPRRQSEVEAQLQGLRQVDEISLLSRCLHVVRGNGYDRQKVDELASASFDRFRSRIFSAIFWPVHDAYVESLKNMGVIDFDDMIIMAAEALEAEKIPPLPYKLIMVDEFQDLSPGRARLVKALLGQHPDDSILFGVGDDWQAINGFAGSDLRLFMEFESTFGKTWEGPLSTTFRCSQGIADVSSWFVMENDYQKRKEVKASNNLDTEGAIHLLDFFNDEAKTNGAMTEIERLLDEIAKERNADEKASVFILGRYRLENTPSLRRDWLDSMAKKHEGVIDLKYKTVHSSKGLEADYVFCVGLNRNKYYNFPSTFETDPIVTMLLPREETFQYAEERRLFYVALTRARYKVFLLFQRNAASPFVVDLMEPQYRGHVQYRTEVKLPERCGGCGQGYLLKRPKKDGTGYLWGCSRYVGPTRPDSCTFWKPYFG